MNKFEGVVTALVTPFENGKIDWASFEKLVDWQINEGIHGLVVCGSTAEAATLSLDEKFELLRVAISKNQKRVPILFGSGTNNTAETIVLSKKAQAAGADGVLVVVPYYNKPPQRGMIAHFESVAHSVAIPVMLYNVPSRTVARLEVATTLKLSQIQNVIGIKEATGDVALVKEIVAGAPKRFIVTSGDDETMVGAFENGAKGVISVLSNIAPKECVEVFNIAQKDISEAKKRFVKLSDLASAIFVESNPIPVKRALKERGIIRSSECRLPLVPLDEKLWPKLKSAMVEAGVLQ